MLEACLRVYNRYGRRDNKYKAPHQDPRPRDRRRRVPRAQVEEEFAQVLSAGAGAGRTAELEPRCAQALLADPGVGEPALADKAATAAIPISRLSAATRTPRRTSARLCRRRHQPQAARAQYGRCTPRTRIGLMADLAEPTSFDETARDARAEHRAAACEAEADLYARLAEARCGGARRGQPRPHRRYHRLPRPRLLQPAPMRGARSRLRRRSPRALPTSDRQRDLGELKLKISGCIDACRASPCRAHRQSRASTARARRTTSSRSAASEADDRLAGADQPARASDEDGIVDAIEKVTERLSRPGTRRRTLPRYLSPHRHGALQGGDLWVRPLLRYRSDEAAGEPVVTLDSFPRRTRAMPLPCGSRRATMPARPAAASRPHRADRGRLPALARWTRLFRRARLLREAGYTGRAARERRCADRPGEPHAPRCGLRCPCARAKPIAAGRRRPRAGDLASRSIEKTADGRLRRSGPFAMANEETRPATEHWPDRWRHADRIDTGPRFQRKRRDPAQQPLPPHRPPPAEMLRSVLGDRLLGEVAVVSSFGAESAVLLHLLAAVDK